MAAEPKFLIENFLYYPPSIHYSEVTIYHRCNGRTVRLSCEDENCDCGDSLTFNNDNMYCHICKKEFPPLANLEMLIKMKEFRE